MSPVKASVIIPVFNQADYVGESIQSVLNQTHSNLELIVVDDASTDRTSEVLATFKDPRLLVIIHRENRGLSAARNSGIRASSGELLAFLDGDDFFDTKKIAAHLEFMKANPDVGVTYNARFELNHGRESIRELWRAPVTCTLNQLVMGFPFAPSDMVVRRDWLVKAGIFDESLLFYSEDLDINCRLALAGCRFACVDKALNYRRYYSRRVLRVSERLSAALKVLDRVFEDSRCPADVLKLRGAARAAHCLVWSFYAFSQDDTGSGREFLRNAVRLDPSLTQDAILRSLLLHCVADRSTDHAAELRKIVCQLPPELSYPPGVWSEAAAQGFLLRAITAAMWDRMDEAEEVLAIAGDNADAQADHWLVGLLVTHLLNMEELLGADEASAALGRIERLSQKRLVPTIRELKGAYFLNKGFRSFKKARYSDALGSAGRSILSDCRCARNRGLLSIVAKSALAMLPLPLRGHHATVE